MPPPMPAAPAAEAVKFWSSGTALLDLVLGGGWAEGRVVNIVGDKSSGKTLLAIEACANIVALYGDDAARYAEAENAFDEGYGRRIGMPAGVTLLKDADAIHLVEEFEADLVAWLEKREPGKPCLYILDSLDALSDKEEMKREDAATYGTTKSKFLSEFFRKRNSLISDRCCTLMVISQLRDNIGVTFGEKHKRSGGRALDFYASQVIWLAELKKLTRTVNGVKRTVGAEVLARAKKNKVGTPHRDAELTVLYNYGVDDEASMLNWLEKYKFDDMALTIKECRKAVAECRERGERDALADLTEMLRDEVRKRWQEIEDELMPPMSKYGK